MIEERSTERDIWVAIESGHNTIYQLTFEPQKATIMALRSLVHLHNYREFQVNEKEAEEITKLAQENKWTQLYNYLVKKGLILKTFRRW